MADALAFGGACLSLLNHADRVTAACLAQLVNAIAPIMTENGGPAWRQTIFWPFAQWSRYGRGQVLRAVSDSPTYDARYFDPRGAVEQYFPITAPYLKLSAVHQDDGSMTIFALNRSLDEAMPLAVAIAGFPALKLMEAQSLHHPNLEAVNTAASPNEVTPQTLSGVAVAAGHLTATLPPASWTLIRLSP
jgi:alpha-N-arabinofuranosidase